MRSVARWTALAAVPLLILVLAAPPAHATTGPYDTAVLADNPSVFWRLDVATGVGHDETGHLADGAVSVCGSCAGRRGALKSEPANTAVAFDGASLVYFPAHTAVLSQPASWSVEAWIKLPVNPTGTEYVYGMGSDISGQSLGVTDGHVVGLANLGCNLCDPIQYTLTSPSTYGDKKWHYLVLSRDSVNGTLSLFVDGGRVATQAVGTDVTHYDPFSTSLPAIGAWEAGFDTLDYFTGSIDEVAVYPVALTRAQMKSHRTAAR
jgi:hypothetical protein